MSMWPHGNRVPPILSGREKTLNEINPGENLPVPNHRDVSVLQLALKGLVGRPSARLDIVDLLCVDIRCRSTFVAQVMIVSRHGWVGVHRCSLGLKCSSGFMC